MKNICLIAKNIFQRVLYVHIYKQSLIYFIKGTELHHRLDGTALFHAHAIVSHLFIY